MIKVKKIYRRIHKFVPLKGGRTFDGIVVDLLLDGDNRCRRECSFGREDDIEEAINTGVDDDFYGYLPDSCFDSVRAGRTKAVKEYIENVFD